MVNSEIGTSTDNTLGGEYDVFLSFRGPDTRFGFTNCLYHALEDVGIRVYIDDEELRPGERISDELPRAIDDSKLYIPIFSKTYASSKWCLRELSRMVENTFKPKEDGKVILPIFYDVKPDDVKLKTALYTDAISNLEQKVEDQKKKFNSEEVDAWRQALKQVDDTKGWELEKYSGHGCLIKLVVAEVMSRLKTRQRQVPKDLVGMEDQITAINELVAINSSDVRLIGICGMGGIGKTTLAKVIFNQLCPCFGKHCSFLDDVREGAKTKLVELQVKLLSDISNSSVAGKIRDKEHGITMIEQTICNKKVLIVLDDVDNSNQIQNLIGVNSLYPGTRILVTTRDKSVLNIREFNIIKAYEMVGLSDIDALRLFSKRAFNDNSPPADYDTLSKGIISTADGLPLALEAIGSSLFRQENKEIWEETLEKLRKTSSRDVLKKLRISYDALEPEQQQIFLDVACFFVGEKKTNPMYVWNDCEFGPEGAIDVLIKRCMMKVSYDKFWMHNQFIDLGREIAKEECTRLWSEHNASCKLRSTQIKESVTAIRLASWGWPEPPITVTSEQIKQFPNLRFLWLHAVKCQGDFTGCLSELKWIDLQYSYSIPPRPAARHPWFKATDSLHLEKVVVVNLSGLDFTEDVFKSLIKGARKLRVLTLCYNTLIHGTLTFPMCLVLKKLTVSYFLSLMEIDCSIGKLKELTYLSFESCWELRKLPERIGELQKLCHLSLRGCHSLTELPDSVSKLKSLKKLDVSRTGITRLPNSIGKLPSLLSADVSHTPIAEMPSTMSEFPQLQTLNLVGCHAIKELPELPRSLTTLRLRSTSLLTVPNLSYLTNLVELVLSDGSDLAAGSNIIQTCDLPWIGSLTKLRKLRFCFSNVRAPATELGSLSLLNELTLYGLDLPIFEQLPSNLTVLELYDTREKQVHLDEEMEIDTRGKQVPLDGLPQLEKETDTQGKQAHLDGEKETDTRGKQVHLDRFPQLEKESDTRGKQVHLDGEKEIDTQGKQDGEKETDSRGKQVHLDGLPQLEKDTDTLGKEDGEKEIDTRGKQIQLEGLPQSEKETALDLTSLRESRENENKYLMHIELEFIHGHNSLENESLERSRFFHRKSSKRLVCPPEKPGGNEPQAPELTGHQRGAFLFPSSQKMLKILLLSGFPEVQHIQFVSPFESLEEFSIEGCSSLKSLGGLSNLKNLKRLDIHSCESLRVVEGINELEYLYRLEIDGCPSMERIFDALSSKIPSKCQTHITCSGELLDCGQSVVPWESYKEKILNGTEQAPDFDIRTTYSETSTCSLVVDLLGYSPWVTDQESEEEEERNKETESANKLGKRKRETESANKQGKRKRETESAKESPLRVSGMVRLAEDYINHKEQRKRKLDYFS